MEQTATSLSNLQTRAFALLRKWMRKGSLDETETHELVEIQKEIPTASVKTEHDTLKSIVETRFDSVDAKFDSVDAKFDSIKESMDDRFDSVNTKFDSVDAKFDSIKESMDDRFDSVDAKFDSVNTRIDSVKESQEIRFSIVLRWLKILTGVGLTLLLAMAGWLIRFLFTGIS